MHPNVELIETFYSAFARGDAETMAACYTTDAHFSDPVFPKLHGLEVGDMWRMLTSRAQDFSLKFDDVSADDVRGEAHWIATYVFSQTGRVVINDIRAEFIFKNGKIAQHKDRFDLWRWARQALGIKGLLLGWAPFVQSAIRLQAAKGLSVFLAKKESRPKSP